MKTEIKLTGIDGVVDLLEGLPKAIAGGGTRAALRKGAQVIRKEEIKNLRSVTSNQTASGQRESTGLLAKNVIVSRGRMPAGAKGEKMIVRVRRKAYTTTPDGDARKGSSVTSTIANAQRLEYGTHDQPAEPWIRPAFAAKASEAIRTVTGSLLTELDKAAARYLKRRS